MSKIPSQLIQMESWARCLRGRIFSCSRWNRIFFLAIFWNSTNLGMHHSLDNRVLVYDYFSTSQRQSHSVLHMYFFLLLYIETYLEQNEVYIPSFILSDLELSRIKLSKLPPSILMEILIVSFVLVDQFYFFMHQLMHKAWLFDKFIFELDASSYSFKVTCIILRQVISFRKMVMLSAKLTILISWSPICVPLIPLLD